MNALAYQFDDDDEVSARYKSVCYRCRYVGLPGTKTRCPLCEFPLILEAANADEEEAEVSVERLFERSEVTPLPGVDGTPRKAQLLAEARKQRRSAEVRATAESYAAAERPRAASPAKAATAARGISPTADDVDMVPSLRPLSARIGGIVLGTLLLAGAAVAGLAAAMV
jgi:hypothetical protein